ncbi:MAG: hypothetical protein NVSMB29_09390 [Candidatus Dormibacteria bacterium]
MSAGITVYVREGDPVSAALLQYLDSRGVEYARRDVDSDPSAQAILFGRLGRVAAPVTQVGELMLPGFDPLQLARFLPKQVPAGQPVSFGAAVRTVTAEVARAAGLAAPFGVEVGPVRPGSPAASAGIDAGDVISAIGPYTLTGGRDQFATAVAARGPGDTMSLTVNREGVAREVAVVFPEADAQSSGAVGAGGPGGAAG